jgi:hypothetical protein
MDRDELRIGSTRMTFEDPASTVLARIQAEADLSVDLEPDPFDSFDDELSGHDTPSDGSRGCWIARR